MFQFAENIFLWTIINFAILLFLVHKFALPPFYKLLETREKKRQELIDNLQKNNDEAKAINEAYQEKLAQIDKEAKKILRGAFLEKEKIKKTSVEEALVEKQKILNAIKDELAIEKKRFLTDMQETAVDLVLYCSKKIIQKELSAESHEKLIQQNVADLEKIIKL